MHYALYIMHCKAFSESLPNNQRPKKGKNTMHYALNYAFIIMHCIMHSLLMVNKNKEKQTQQGQSSWKYCS